MKLPSVTAVATVVALTISACGPQGKIRFYRDDTVIFTHALAPGERLALGQGDLGPVPGEPIAANRISFELDPQVSSVVMPTTVGGQPGPPITLRRQVEAHLFARDPQEVFDTLAGNVDDRPDWLRQTSVPSVQPGEGPPWRLPDDAVVPYPFAPHFIPKPTVLRPVVPRDFWRESNPAVRAGPGNEPSGQASVKAVRVLPVGLCSTEQPIEDIVKSVGQQVSASFLSGACKPGNLDGEIYYLDAVSYLARQRRDRPLRGDDDAGGGFFLHGRVRVHDAGIAAPFSLDACYVAFNYDYRFYLKDGRLAIAHTRHQYHYDDDLALCSGFLGHKGFADRLADALQIDLEAGFFAESSRRQLYTRPSDDFWSCPLGEPPQIACAHAAGRLELAIVTRAAHVLGLPNSGKPGSPVERLVAAVRRPENWQCTNYPEPADPCRGKPAKPQGRCEYIVRAKRINVTPHEVELVWFDDVDDFDNATFALFVASFAPDPGSGQIDFNAYRNLCSRRLTDTLAQAQVGPGSDNYYNKHFARFRLDDTQCDALPPPQKPPQCPCTRDGDCPTGVTCDVNAGICRDMCFSRSDCVYPQRTCYQDLFRCGGADCITDSMCHAYEYCSFQLGVCQPRPH